MFSFLNVYKPKGMTSHDVVSFLRRLTSIKQIGHAGTLDPFAEGVLPVAIGKATRLFEYLNDDKAYIGTVQLGSATTTYDLEGEIVKSSDITPSKDDVEEALENFKGAIEQIPPAYSAIKIKGKKLYEYARKGQVIDIAPRKVTIYENKILNYDQEKRILELYISCSKGTYIRSIANDIGEYLQCFGHLIKLVRVQAGNFKIENAVKLENLNSVLDVTDNIINPLNILDLHKYYLANDEYEKISHGMQIPASGEFERVSLVYDNKLVGIGFYNAGNIIPEKVFV